jgi:hypothetical protein
MVEDLLDLRSLLQTVLLADFSSDPGVVSLEF